MRFRHQRFRSIVGWGFVRVLVDKAEFLSFFIPWLEEPSFSGSQSFSLRLTQFSGLACDLGGLHLEVKKESPLKEQVSIVGNGANASFVFAR
jgi:hypothetical protein